jgi:hypothetical protein
MTTAAVALPNATAYDFTADSTLTYDCTHNAIKNVVGLPFGSGAIYAMIAGDADGNGAVLSTDKNSYWRVQNGTSGYLKGDFNLDGNVLAGDKNSYWRKNNGTATKVP